MKKLDSFFQRIQQFLPFETKVREIVLPILNEVVHITIPRKNIRVVKKNLIIKAEPVVKMHIRKHEQKILKALQEQGIILERIS